MNHGAFGGEPAARAALLARIDAHVAAGTLDIAADQPWRDGRGTPMGVSIEGDDPRAYAEAFGYPLSLASALDLLARETGDGFDGVAFAREWVEAVTPGADLSRVAPGLMLHMLSFAHRLDDDDALTDGIAVLHARDAEGQPPSSDEWSALRARVAEREAQAQARGSRAVATAAFWSAACWPANRGRSVLVSTMQAWRRLEALPRSDWSDEEEARAHAMLQTIWDELHAAREAGDEPSYVTLFRQRDPVLAKRFEANLQRSNARFLTCGVEIARLCLSLLRSAPTLVVAPQMAGGSCAAR